MIKETGEALKDADGNEVTKTVKFIPEDRNGSITVEFEVDTKDIPGKSLVVFEDCWQDTYHIWLHASLEDTDQTVVIPKAGRIYVMKKGVVPVGKVTNEDGTATLKYDYIYLPGVEFTVYKDADCTEEVTKIVTDGKEKAASELLQVGTYYIKETFAPEGYVKDNTVYEKTLVADAETDIVIDVTMDLVNRLASATLKVYKADPSKRPLKGVVYGLFANEDKLFDLFNRNGFSKGYYGQRNGREMMSLKETSFRAHDESFIGRINDDYIKKDIRRNVQMKIVMKKGQNIKVLVYDDENRLELSYSAPDAATGRPLLTGDVKKQFSKSGGTDFNVTDILLDMDNDIFVPVSAMNSMRRVALNRFKELLLEKYRKSAERKEEKSIEKARSAKEETHAQKKRVSVKVTSYDQLTVCLDSGLFDRFYLSPFTVSVNDLKAV